MFKKTGTIIISAMIIIFIFLTVSAQKPSDSLYSYIRLSSDIAFRISARYVDDIEAKDLIYSGIRGMLNTLDPFSEFLEQVDYDKLQETTKGKYQGLGMTIMLKDEVVTVVAPMEGTPAYRMGLRPGDQIIKIDGKSTRGMSTQEASSLMRGPAGTKVTLTIKRQGVDESLEYTIERAVIELKTVPFYSTFEANGSKLGYVRLARFGEEAKNELDVAFKEVIRENVDGLIFDLRSNGGGLLNQAVNVADYFLPKGAEVTSTKGRTPDQNRTLYANHESLIPLSVPLVILVNGMSASASEIVAGAIQDWDRGVIIGSDTFGKGLVQQVYPLSDDVALKLTTAKWYIPSGRCIQKDSRSTRRSDNLNIAEKTGDEVEEEKEVFFTMGGRVVYGGGGVIPDIEVEEHKLSPLELNLERLSVFFDFSIKYTTEHPDLSEDFEVTPQLIDEFKQFLEEKDFSYKSQLEKDFERLEKTIEQLNRITEYSELLNDLKHQVEIDKQGEFDESVEYLSRSIKRDMLTKLHGEKAVYRQIVLKTDPCLKKAVEMLTSVDEYSSILESGG